MEYYPDIMYHKVLLCPHVTLPSFSQDRVKVVTKILGLVQTKTENDLLTERRVRPASVIHDVVAKVN